jgi:hypothetical protein
MIEINNPSEIGNVRAFIRRHERDAVHIGTGEYDHFYLICAEGFSMGVSRSRYAGFENIAPVCWAIDNRAEEIRETLIRRSLSHE